MRPASIETTMSYYVALDTADVADELWAKFGPPYNNPYNNRPGMAKKAETAPADELTKAIETARVISAEGTGLEPATPYGAPHFQCGR